MTVTNVTLIWNFAGGKSEYESHHDRKWVTKIDWEKKILKKFLDKEKKDSNKQYDYWLQLKLFLEAMEKHQLLAKRYLGDIDNMSKRAFN